MEEKTLRQKADISFFRFMLFMSMLLHICLFVFFMWLEIPVLYFFNVMSILLYLILLILVGRIVNIEHWMLLPFLEVVIHAVLCNLFLGWGFGFSLYGLMVIPITYYIAYASSQEIQGILAPTVLASADVIVITISCLKTGYMNNYPHEITPEMMLLIFCINLFLCVASIMAYSAYFVNGMRRQTRLLTEQNEELDFIAHHDPVTMMRNRQNMHEVFDIFENSGNKFCLAMGDLDDFKYINDTYGHVCGDEFLTHISYLIRQELRNRGEVCRWGSDEILLLIKMGEMEGFQLAEGIRQKISRYVLEFEGAKVHATATFGFVFCDEAMSMEKRISIADSRLYEGKRNGKNRVVR